MRISDWSSDVCSSDLAETDQLPGHFTGRVIARIRRIGEHTGGTERQHALGLCRRQRVADVDEFARCACLQIFAEFAWLRSEEHTSELQSLMRSSYAVFCLKKKTSTDVIHRHPSTTNETTDTS